MVKLDELTPAERLQKLEEKKKEQEKQLQEINMMIEQSRMQLEDAVRAEEEALSAEPALEQTVEEEASEAEPAAAREPLPPVSYQLVKEMYEVRRELKDIYESGLNAESEENSQRLYELIGKVKHAMNYSDIEEVANAVDQTRKTLKNIFGYNVRRDGL